MRKVFAIAVLAMNASCGAIKDEAGYAGGYIERVANERLFEARAQEQRADRYLMSLVILAPLAADLAQGPAEAQAVSVLIDAAYSQLGNMYDAAGTCLGNDADCPNTSRETLDISGETPDIESKNSAFAFENHTHEMQRSLYALAKQTLGAVDLDDVVDDVLKLNISALYKSAKKAVPIYRRLLSTYRDTVVAFADAVHIACDKKTDGDCGLLKDQILQIKTGANTDDRFLVLHEDRIIRALLASINAVSDKDAHEWYLQEKHIRGLTYHIDRACLRLATMQIRVDTKPADQKKITNCGTGINLLPKVPVSDARNEFLKAAVKRSKATKVERQTTVAGNKTPTNSN